MHPHHINLQFIDSLAVLLIAGSFAQIIPAAAAMLAVVWYCVQIWESDTVRGWTNRDIEKGWSYRTPDRPDDEKDEH